MKIVHRLCKEIFTNYEEIINPTEEEWIEISDYLFKLDPSKFILDSVSTIRCEISTGYYILKEEDVEKINKVRETQGIPIISTNYKQICVIVNNDELSILRYILREYQNSLFNQ